VQVHLQILIPLSTAHGQRIKKTVDLAKENWDSICSNIQRTKEHEAVRTFPLSQIESLTVGPFRGFKKQTHFDLASKLVLIYGPNGTGKSSFCEALEYALLGNVTEAESKRFRNQDDYFKNAHTRDFIPPLLTGMQKEETNIPITENESLYRFCFIEKNRIDNFSRIAAQVPAKQTELISTLFGLDTFTEFVRNFTDSMDKYIDLEGEKAKELSKKEQVLAGCKQHLEKAPEELLLLDEEEKALANEFRCNCTFSQMVLELNGSNGNNGLIAQIETELEKHIGTKKNLTFSELKILKQSLETNILDLAAEQQNLAKVSQQVSYKQLYEAIIQVKENNSGRCPACQTPLSQVTINPFNYADTELKKLQHLGELQELIKEKGNSINKTLTKLSTIIDTCCLKVSDNNVLSAFKIGEGTSVTIDWWDSLHLQLTDGFTPWQYVEARVKDIENTDKEIDKVMELRTEKQNDLKRLRKCAEKIVKLQTRRDSITQTIKNSNEEIENFKIENALLIEEVATEKDVIARNQSIANAYTIFVQMINTYNNNLPAQLVKDLGETIVLLYNAFNRQDAEYEKLAVVKLPLQQNQQLKISFKNEPTSFFDALHILSEGHIRCIGLAILAAKNIKEDCPFLIFDDPINAIDDDHRESIRKTIFEDKYFEDKQIILACHGEEFFKDIQNLLPAEKVRQSKALAFLPKNGDLNICVDSNCAPRNYVVASRAHFEKNEIRDSLDKSRKALESFAKQKIWCYVNKYGDGNLSIKMRSATAPIELRNLTEQLKNKIAKGDFSDQNKDVVLHPIESLLGINGDSREWRYLNKGTHEEADRAEFDRQTVNEIVTALEQLDAAFP